MNPVLAIILIFLLPAWVIAADFTKEDFAYGLILETDNQGAFYTVSLPHDVYVNTALNMLSDMRVFNSDDQVVPHDLRFPEAPEEQEHLVLPFFPLFAEQHKHDGELSMRIETGSGGEIVNIEKSSSAANDFPIAYVIDTQGKEHDFASFQLTWKTTGPGRMLPVLMEDSADLITWRKVTRATLADLIFMDNRLQHGEIILPRKAKRYLRIRAENSTPMPDLTMVEAIFHPPRQQSSRRWFSTPFKEIEEDGRRFLEMEPVSGMLIDGLKVEFSQPNSLLKLKITSFDDQGKLYYRGEGLFYHLEDNGNALLSDPLFFRQHRPTILRLELVEKPTGANLDSTTILLGYTPQELVFVARGSSPYLLAYGNGKMVNLVEGSQASAFQSLTANDEQNLIRQAKIGERVILGGEKMLVIPKPSPWKKWVLWLVLIGGVALLAAMTWSLMRKMKR